MKTLNEIKRNIIAYYSRIQNRVTDFAVGSVVHDIIFSFSAALEDIHRELADIEKQAYISTATGAYLDKLIDGTFQLKRSPATKSIGYVVVYGDSPLPNPGSVKLRYADFNYSTGEFTGGLQGATKFIGFNNQGDDGIVYALIQPRNLGAVLPNERLINLGGRNVQYLILPVASVLSGQQTNIIEGGITSFPSSPPGLGSVLNTSNPGLVFFSSGQPLSSAPFYSRFTEMLSYNEGVMQVVNAYNFSPRGHLEITRDVNEKAISGIYSDVPIGAPNATTRQAGLIFEYISQDTSSLTLKDTILGSPIPFIQVNEGGVLKKLILRSFSYDGTTYTYPSTGNAAADETAYKGTINTFVSTNDGLIVTQRPDQISETLVFDPDNILTSDYHILDSNMVSGGVDAAGDEEYREALRKYLNSLARATPSALEAGALQISGITFAKTLPASLVPRGSTILLVSNDDGVVSAGKRYEVKQELDQYWKAAGVNLIVSSPELIKTHVSMVIRPATGALQSTTYNQVASALDTYLRTKNPGDSIKYSEILARLNEISSVENVFNLLVLKDLSIDTYTNFKGEYDFELLSELATGTLEVTQASPALTVGSAVKLVSGHYEDTYPGDSQAVGVVHDAVGDDYFLLLGNAAKLHSMYQTLGDTFTPEDFKAVAYSFKDSLAVNDYEFLYLASYLFSEPLDPLWEEVPYPVNPLEIEYKFVKDYRASAMQIFRLGTTQLTTDKISPVVGIKFII